MLHKIVFVLQTKTYSIFNIFYREIKQGLQTFLKRVRSVNTDLTCTTFRLSGGDPPENEYIVEAAFSLSHDKVLC